MIIELLCLSVCYICLYIYIYIYIYIPVIIITPSSVADNREACGCGLLYSSIDCGSFWQQR